MKKIKFVLIRHGESTWNAQNKFTGWSDVELTKKGKKEALEAAKLLSKKQFNFDIAFTSVLKRAIHSLWIILYDLNQLWIPVKKSWQLNERHYGGLQGLNKSETAIKYGNKKVHQWRRSFDVKPPIVNESSINFPGNDIKYSKVNFNQLPKSESLKCTLKRVIPYWNNSILTEIKKNKEVLIVAHGNSLRALIKYLDDINDEDISDLDIPTGQPIVYELNDDFKPIKNYFL